MLHAVAGGCQQPPFSHDFVLFFFWSPTGWSHLWVSVAGFSRIPHISFLFFFGGGGATMARGCESGPKGHDGIDIDLNLQDI